MTDTPEQSLLAAEAAAYERAAELFPCLCHIPCKDLGLWVSCAQCHLASRIRALISPEAASALERERLKERLEEVKVVCKCLCWMCKQDIENVAPDGYGYFRHKDGSNCGAQAIRNLIAELESQLQAAEGL